jgi:hypothetical protein
LQELNLVIREIEKQLSSKISNRYIDEIDLRTCAMSATITGPAGGHFWMFHYWFEKNEACTPFTACVLKWSTLGKSFLKTLPADG